MLARWSAAAAVLSVLALVGCAAPDIPGYEGASAVTGKAPSAPPPAAPAAGASDPAPSGPAAAPPTPPAPTVCVASTADGRLVQVDVDAKTQTPIENLPQQVGALQSFGLRGRQIFFCSGDGKVTRFDLDTRAVTASGVACAAVSADGADIWVLGPDKDVVVGYATFDTVTAQTPATTLPIVFPTPDTDDDDTPAPSVAGIGVADTGILLLQGGTMVGSMDRQTGRILDLTLAGIDGDVASMAQHVTERVAVAAAASRGLVTFDADGNLARKLLEDTMFTGVACAR